MSITSAKPSPLAQETTVTATVAVAAVVDTELQQESRKSVISNAPGTPVPSMVKNRTRTISNVSGLPPSTRNSAIVKPEDSVFEDEDEKVEKKRWLRELRKCIRFCDVGDFTNSSIVGKIIIILFAPIYILCLWTIPVLPLDRSTYDKMWNKPLAMIQALVIPTGVSLLFWVRISSTFLYVDLNHILVSVHLVDPSTLLQPKLYFEKTVLFEIFLNVDRRST